MRRNAGKVPTNNSGTPESIPAVSRTPILTSTQAPAPTPTFTLSLPKRYIDKDLQKIINLALESFVKGQ